MAISWWSSSQRPPIPLMLIFAGAAVMGGINIYNGLMIMRGGTEASQMGLFNVLIGGLFIYVAWSLFERKSWAWSVAIAYLIYKFLFGTLYVVMNIKHAPDIGPLIAGQQVLFALPLWYLFSADFIHFFGLKKIIDEKRQAQTSSAKPKAKTEKDSDKDKKPQAPPSEGIPIDVRKAVYGYLAPIPTVVSLTLFIVCLVTLFTIPATADWTVNTAPGRRIMQVAATPDGETLYVVRPSLLGKSNIYVSADSGQTWTDLHYPVQSAWELIPDPATPKRLFVVTGRNDGVYLFEQEKWRRITPENLRVHAMLWEPGEPGKLLIGAFEKGLLLSEDLGTSWQEVAFDGGEVSCLVRDRVNGYLYVGSWQKGLYRTKDEGKTWEQVQITGVTSNSYLALSAEGRVMVTQPIAAFGPAPIYYSTDYGKTWAQMTVPSGGVNKAFFAPNNTLFTVTFAGGAYYSNDYAETWNQLGPQGINLTDMIYLPQQKRLVASSYNRFRYYGLLTHELTLPESLPALPPLEVEPEKVVPEASATTSPVPSPLEVEHDGTDPGAVD